MYYILESNVKCGYDKKKKNISDAPPVNPDHDIRDEIAEEYRSGLFSLYTSPIIFSEKVFY